MKTTWHLFKGWGDAQGGGGPIDVGDSLVDDVLEIAALLRVLPELLRSSDDIAWDTNQQETPASPMYVYGLARKTRNKILHETLHCLFDTPNMYSGGVRDVVTTDVVNERLSLATLVRRAQYNAGATGRSRLWRSWALYPLQLDR